MQELIKIEEREGKKTVNARNLHIILDSKQDFSNWISSRIEKYGFVKGEDFTIVLLKSNGGRPSMEYHVSIDMAKELSMVERNEKGKQARQYFIECERNLNLETSFQVPKTFSEALQLASDQAKQLEEQKPKVEFHDQVLDSEGLLNMGETAKTLGLDYGRNTFFKVLREMKIFFKREPYQQYLTLGYFKVKTTTNNDYIQKQAYTTPKGLVWLQKKFSKV